MKWFKRFFKNTSENIENSDDVLYFARIIGPQIDKLANEIFLVYSNSRTLRSTNFIIQAVWRDEKSGALEKAQREIADKVDSLISYLFSTLDFKNISTSQKFAIEFMVKGLVITKVIYMVEILKNRMVSDGVNYQDETRSLVNIEPIGNA